MFWKLLLNSMLIEASLPSPIVVFQGEFAILPTTSDESLPLEIKTTAPTGCTVFTLHCKNRVSVLGHIDLETNPYEIISKINQELMSSYGTEIGRGFTGQILCLCKENPYFSKLESITAIFDSLAIDYLRLSLEKPFQLVMNANTGELFSSSTTNKLLEYCQLREYGEFLEKYKIPGLLFSSRRATRLEADFKSSVPLPASFTEKEFGEKKIGILFEKEIEYFQDLEERGKMSFPLFSHRAFF